MDIKNINVNAHSSIQIGSLFFDPYMITDSSKKASYIFLTHTHYDHLSPEDIKKVITPETIFIAPKDAKETLEALFPENKKHFVSQNDKLSFENFVVETIPAYNTNKEFHQKHYGWVGYKVTIDGTSYLVTGDTDATIELEGTECDVLFVPIGGTFTMTALEAASLTNRISPKLVIPTHYGSIVGSKEDETTFVKNVNKSIKVKLFPIIKS